MVSNPSMRTSSLDEAVVMGWSTPACINPPNPVASEKNVGEVDVWFPEYDINEDYKSVGVFSEALAAVLKIRRTQKIKDEK